MFQLAIETGLRVSELNGLTRADTHLGTPAHVACHGKGRKDRITPLTKPTTSILRDWLKERGGLPADPLFPTSRGTPLTRDAVARRLTAHATAAAHECSTLHDKTITPHVLRHYVDGWVMWPAGVFPCRACRGLPFRPHNPGVIGRSGRAIRGDLGRLSSWAGARG
jgi:integrase